MFLLCYQQIVLSTNTMTVRKHLVQMDFPAVTICPLNMFAKSKIFMTDNNPLFASSSLNISSCAMTSGVRGNHPCGWSLLCRYALPAMQTFPLVTPLGICYTINSERMVKWKLLIALEFHPDWLSFLMHRYMSTLREGTEGFKVMVHGQGEYISEWEGINVGPGQHVLIALSQKRVCTFCSMRDENLFLQLLYNLSRLHELRVSQVVVICDASLHAIRLISIIFGLTVGIISCFLNSHFSTFYLLEKP